MKTEKYKISEGQFLAEIEPFKTSGLPTNSIIRKELTGCGATTLELNFERNSIIIEPNLPVIVGKCKKLNGTKRKHKVVLGVHESVEVNDIKKYLTNCKGYKKLMTTPEGFGKIIEAIGNCVFTDYFLLFDECEKVIQDISFRDRIIAPMDLFFRFTNKAFVSATPIQPTDPRFKDFTHVYIQADYDHKHDVKVFSTNNIIYQLKTVLDEYTASGADKDRKYFIFCKSTKLIKSVIKKLKLTNHTVFCSEKSTKSLKRDDVSKTSDTINGKFSKYNFLTSRFFSAVDIDYADYACDPIIIMLSDPLGMEHTVIDPSTEAIQIIGRFRNPEQEQGEPIIKVNKDIFHISNYNNKLTNYTQTEIEAILKDKQKLHKSIRTFAPSSDAAYFNKFISDVLGIKGFSYFHYNSAPNYFMIDNWRYNETVKGHYISSYGLLKKYRNESRFIVNDASGREFYILTDEQLNEISDHTSRSKINEFVGKRLKEIMETKMSAQYKDFNIELLRFNHPQQMTIIDKFTLVKAAEFDYDIDKIEQHKQELKESKNIQLIKKFAKAKFELKGYTTEEIETLLIEIITASGLKGYKPNVKLLRKMTKLSKRKNIKRDVEGSWQKGYKIISFLD